MASGGYGASSGAKTASRTKPTRTAHDSANNQLPPKDRSRDIRPARGLTPIRTLIAHRVRPSREGR